MLNPSIHKTGSQYLGSSADFSFLANRPGPVLLACLAVLFFAGSTSGQDETEHRSGESAVPTVSVEIDERRTAATARIDGELFTAYRIDSLKKPVLYPLNLRDGLSLTRHWPLAEKSGEAHDHPHHKSVWFSHQINGVMFWSEAASVQLVRLSLLEETQGQGWLAEHRWVHDEQTVMTDKTTYKFSAGTGWRAVDVQIELLASHGDVLFNDTKEGSFAVRVHPGLRNKPDAKAGIAGGATMLNSESETGPGIWGKPARWIDYSNTIDGTVCGLAIFDHPDNLRHPTTWHARDYGLLAANPFGLHYFDKQPAGAGEYTIPAGESLVLKYRILLHEGDAEQAKIDQHYQQFAGTNEDTK